MRSSAAFTRLARYGLLAQPFRAGLRLTRTSSVPRHIHQGRFSVLLANALAPHSSRMISPRACPGLPRTRLWDSTPHLASARTSIHRTAEAVARARRVPEDACAH